MSLTPKLHVRVVCYACRELELFCHLLALNSGSFACAAVLCDLLALALAAIADSLQGHHPLLEYHKAASIAGVALLGFCAWLVFLPLASVAGRLPRKFDTLALVYFILFLFLSRTR